VSRRVAFYYRSSRFAWLAILAGFGALLSAYLGQNLALSIVTCTFFILPMAALTFLALQPEVVVYDTHLAIGRRTIPWTEITGVDHLNWTVPLVVRLTLLHGEHRTVLYPGDHGHGTRLLDHLRRMARNAVLDGIPYEEFWAASVAATSLDSDAQALTLAISRANEPTAPELGQPDSAKAAAFPLLSPEDEREVELLYQRLKSVGHIDALETESRDPQE
jgi:hypothetical protein